MGHRQHRPKRHHLVLRTATDLVIRRDQHRNHMRLLTHPAAPPPSDFRSLLRARARQLKQKYQQQQEYKPKRVRAYHAPADDEQDRDEQQQHFQHAVSTKNWGPGAGDHERVGEFGEPGRGASEAVERWWDSVEWDPCYEGVWDWECDCGLEVGASTCIWDGVS